MTDARKREKRWSFSTGERGRNRVRAFEHQTTGRLFLEYYEPSRGGTRPVVRRVALGHRDRDRAKGKAEELAAKLRSATPMVTAHISLARLFDIYLAEATPTKGKGKQQHDRSSAALFLRAFGRDREARTLSRREWDRFIRDRRKGLLRPSLRRLKKGKRVKPHPVGERVIGYDLPFLQAVLNWAAVSSDGRGGTLLERNPLKGLDLPKEENPRRPLVSDEEYEQLLAVADQIHPRCRLAFVLAHETGHRTSAVRQLRWSDVDLERRRIRWRAGTDKSKYEHETPLTAAALKALEAARSVQRAIGGAWVFPDSEDPSQPATRNTFVHWWRRAEELSGIERVSRRGWHSLRRKFATELKHVPLADLKHLGGWKTAKTILECYTQPDEQTMRSALEGRKRITAGGVG